MPLIPSYYYPKNLFKNGHFSTIYSAKFRLIAPITYHRKRLKLNDGDFLDLDWSDAVLDFYKTAEKRKLISTPSYDQVNKPIYSKSVFKWKNYEKNLSEIIPTLKPWLTRFKY